MRIPSIQAEICRGRCASEVWSLFYPRTTPEELREPTDGLLFAPHAWVVGTAIGFENAIVFIWRAITMVFRR